MEIKTYTPETANNDAIKSLRERLKAAQANRASVKSATAKVSDSEKIKSFFERLRASRKANSEE